VYTYKGVVVNTDGKEAERGREERTVREGKITRCESSVALLLLLQSTFLCAHRRRDNNGH